MKKDAKSRVEHLDKLILFLDQLAAVCDPYISDHSTHVRDLAVQLAVKVDFPSKKLKVLSHAAPDLEIFIIGTWQNCGGDLCLLF